MWRENHLKEEYALDPRKYFLNTHGNRILFYCGHIKKFSCNVILQICLNEINFKIIMNDY